MGVHLFLRPDSISDLCKNTIIVLITYLYTGEGRRVNLEIRRNVWGGSNPRIYA